MHIEVLITTYNREQLLANLLSDLEREARGLDVRLVIVDDASTPVYTPRTDLPAELIRMPSRNGRLNYWKTVNAGLVRLTSPDYFVMLPDDVRLTKGFFHRAIETFVSIRDERKICLSVSLDGRETKPNWTNSKPVERVFGQVRVWQTQWNDLAFIAPGSFLRIIGRINPRPPGYEAASSGVGRDISLRLHRLGYSMFHTDRTMVLHGDHPSVMHPEVRIQEPLIARDGRK